MALHEMKSRSFGIKTLRRTQRCASDLPVSTIDRTVDQRSTPIRWLILGGAVLIAAIVFSAVAMITTFRDRALATAERELSNTVLLLSRHFDQQFEDFDEVLKEVSAQIRMTSIEVEEKDFERQMSVEGVHEMLKEKVGGSLDTVGVSLFDSAGRLINSSQTWPVPDVSITDRDFFNSFRSNATDSPLLIELVHSHLFNGWAIVFARRLVDPHGKFLGVVTRGISPAHFAAFFASLALGSDTTISLVHRDGETLARYPQLDGVVGRNFKGAPLQAVLSGANHANLRIVSPVDGRQKLGSVHALGGFPMSIVATRAVSAALSDWREQTHLLVAAALLSVCVTVGTLLLVIKALLQQSKNSQDRIALEKQKLDVAINNMTPALLLYDSEQRLVVCNSRYVELFGLSSEVVKPGCSFRDELAQRIAAGAPSEDIDKYCASFFSALNNEKTAHSSFETPDGRAFEGYHQALPDGGWVSTIEEVTERKRYEDQITHLAHYDSLTGLPNRFLFQETLQRELDCLKSGKQIAVLYIDLDGFKGVNDSLGHDIGDALLAATAHRLKNQIASPNFVARLGGDEFAIIEIGHAEEARVAKLAGEISSALRQPFLCHSHHILTDASIGVALSTDKHVDHNQLLKKADMAMYAAKDDGRGTYRFFKDEMDARVRDRHWISSELRQIVLKGDYARAGFELHYQPLVNLHTDEISGCEVLLRWRHRDRGNLPPDQFISVAEETGLICQLGEWVLKQACADASSWPTNIRLAVNVSPVQFRSSGFALAIASSLGQSGLSANRLELEITEAVLIRDDRTTLEMLHQIRGLGIRIALDDFGTGYSSLSYLRKFPFDKIKIDRSFIADIADPNGATSIIKAVVDIAKSRDIITTAEGVETHEQRDILRRLGCTEMQGYLFSPARPLAELHSILHSNANGIAIRVGT